MDIDSLTEEKEQASEGDNPTGKKDKLADSAKLAARWSVELNASKRWMSKFHRSARECERQYIDMAEGSTDRSLADYSGKTNLFWSNVQVILSAIYGSMPKAEVNRKFDDFDDDVSRVAGIIMQRILNGDMERDWDDTNAAMRDAVQDRFIAGLGQVWCRYDVQLGKTEQPMLDERTGQAVIDAETGQPATEEVETIESEEAEVDYVHWSDFRYSPCRRWRECRWVARRVYMSAARLKERFKLTDVQAGMIPMQSRSQQTDDQGNRTDDVLRATPFKQAAVWEIWSRDDNYVCWFVEGCSFVLDQQPDPLELEDFFPCPQPVVATTLTGAFLPRPDYAMAQDLYKELDRVNSKLSHLTDAVKAAGVYDKTAGPVKTLLTTAVENALVPVDNWSAFVEKGGMRGVVDWMPIEQFVNAIVQLNQRKQQLQADLYEVLGISDIMRGASNASETLGAQQLKVQYGGARLANLQNDVARFVSETMRIRANIIANVFQPETIIKRSLIERTPDAPYAQPAVQMLKDFSSSLFSINVTSDSLAAPDWAAEKEARTEFLGAASNYIMSAGPIVSSNPQVGTFLVKLLQWAAAGFKGAKTIEGVLDQAAKQLEQQAAKPPAPPQPTPEDRKDDAAAKKSAADAQRALAEAAKVQQETILIGGMPGGMTPGGPPGGPMPGPMPAPGGVPPGMPPPNGGPPPGGPPPGGPGMPPPGGMPPGRPPMQ
jgi:hypothetical protein